MSKAIAATLNFLNSSSSLSIAGMNRLNESTLQEGKHLVKKLESNGVSAKVYKDTEWQEYVVRFFGADGKEFVDADYHTDDLDDAIGTAQAQMEQLGKVNEEVSEDDLDEAKSPVTPYKVGDKVTVNGKRGEINYVHLSDDPEYDHSYKITDLDANDPYKQKRLENGNFINHSRVKPMIDEGAEKTTYSAYDKDAAVQEMVPLNATTQEEAIEEAKSLGKERGWKLVGVKQAKWTTDDSELDEGIGDFVAGVKGGVSGLAQGVKGALGHMKNAYANGRDQNIINKNQAKIDALKAKMDARAGNAPAQQQSQQQQRQEPTTQQQSPTPDANGIVKFGKRIDAVNYADKIRSEGGKVLSVGNFKDGGSYVKVDTAQKQEPTMQQSQQQAPTPDKDGIVKFNKRVDAVNYAEKIRSEGGNVLSVGNFKDGGSYVKVGQQASAPQQASLQSDAIKSLSQMSSSGKLDMNTAREIIKLADRLKAQGI